ncbi:MAG: DNA recombination protein RmuC [Phycisphaerales bacterium]|nr:DNA recombination protein RmuC [Phycisphaerales bacterium]
MPDAVAIVSLIVSLATLIVAGVLLVSLRRAAARIGGADAGRAESEAIRAAAADIVERMTRSQGELRQELADRLTRQLGDVSGAISESLRAGRDEQSRRLAEATQRLDTRLEAFAEGQGRGLGESRRELTESLRKVAESLDNRLTQLDTRTRESLDNIRAQVDQKLAAIQENVQHKLDENIKSGFAHFEKVQQHLQAAAEQLKAVTVLGDSVASLNAMLKLPHLRGKFGEASLERLLADFLPPHMFEVQTSAANDGSRPDAIIRFPDRILPIDSKFPGERLLPLFESENAEELRNARAELTKVIKAQAKSVSKYVEVEKGTTTFALMYLPSETLWYEVIRDTALYEHIVGLKVFPVSPNTLLLALHTIEQTHKWYKIASGFEDTRRELELARRHFDLFQQRYADIGSSLEKAQEAFQTATRHLSNYESKIRRLTDERVIAEAQADERTLFSAPPTQAPQQLSPGPPDSADRR